MKILSYLDGMCSWHAPWEELRPRDGIGLPTVVQAVKDRYGFQNVGTSAVAQQQGLATPMLQYGTFNAEVAIAAVEFTPGALSVNCPKTSDAEAVLRDLTIFLVSKFGFRMPDGERPYEFRSMLVFEPSSAALERYVNPWRDIGKRIASKMGKPEVGFEPLGLRFFSRQQGRASLEFPFVIEPRNHSPEGSNWLFSQAPLRSEDHTEILESMFGRDDSGEGKSLF